ncbi:peptidase U32 family protein, partial [Ilyobacter sp.]|uniref:peptidase U32 family protein n=1 Tax=Ilyobacter sp. TaxID=3100343 RepID=UPI0035647BA5
MNIVAPAGNMERFYAAVKAGADEIYMGIKGFGARRNAENFTLSEYMEAMDYAHERGTKVFLTLNTVMRDKEIEALYENLKALYERGLDAVIVQDLGLFRFIKDNFPDIDIHGSTQMTVSNHVEADYLKKIGFSRVVLARELSFEEIRSVKENTDIELEIFVSGALCISYSGNCYLSSFIGGRSGNRGLCAQPCRKEYETSQGDRGYFLSPKDQLMGEEEIKKLKDIGVKSIKLEGRMKSPQYVFETVAYYKSLIDGIYLKERTSDLFNRGYSKGYFYGDRENIINSRYSSDFGKCIGSIEGKEIKISEELI